MKTLSELQTRVIALENDLVVPVVEHHTGCNLPNFYGSSDTVVPMRIKVVDVVQMILNHLNLRVALNQYILMKNNK